MNDQMGNILAIWLSVTPLDFRVPRLHLLLLYPVACTVGLRADLGSRVCSGIGWGCLLNDPTNSSLLPPVKGMISER